MYRNKFREISELLGKTLVEITGPEKVNEEILFICSDGTAYMMYHEQDCCESVLVEDVCGDINCLLNSPLLMAEDVSNNLEVQEDEDDWGEHYTWTWYKFATVKDYVTLRWYGTSNGYYSESVDFVIVQ